MRINQDFEIPTDTYTVTFEWITFEGEVISDQVTVFIDVVL